MITVLFSVMLLAAETGAATATTTTTEAPTAVEAPKEEKKICKRDMATESRLGSKRTCLTAAQWKARDTGEIEYRRNGRQ
ncbi:MAG TPA: hypothetical protein VGD23_08435 [Sphingomicrobium sp.]